VERKIPFSCTYGNHDIPVSRVELSVYDQVENFRLMMSLMAFAGILRVSYSSTSLINKLSSTNDSSISVKARIACRIPDRMSDHAHTELSITGSLSTLRRGKKFRA
jgi:hypothetical protein